MINDYQIESIYPSLVLNAIESLQKCVSGNPQYSFSIDEILDIIPKDGKSNKYIPRIDLTDSDDDDDETNFNQSEWSVRDTTTKKIRPPRLYEFLLILLNNSRYKSYASWLNQNEGLFQIHEPRKVVELWENVKIRHSNNKMDYDSFTRAIRDYYKTGLMVATYKKQTYRFVVQK